MVAITVRALTKVFADDGVRAVDGVDLDVAAGEFLVVLGPSGCGKSTLLRLIAGIEAPTSGDVLFDGVSVAELPARERNIAMVFQNYALYPHLTVAQNIGFPLRASGDEPREVAARIAEAARHLGIADLLSRLPDHLSGGQRQRVAMARALVRRPSVLLLDEPMSNVDPGVRAELRGEIISLARRLAVTTVYVTHDQGEAMSMAGRIAILRSGVLQQAGPPAEVYADPATLFVAAFLGTPRPSLIEAAVYATDGRVVLDLGSQLLEIPADDPRSPTLAARHTERVTLAVRALRQLQPPTPHPSGTHLSGAEALGAEALGEEVSGMRLSGIVRRVENLGHEVLAHLDIGAVPTPPPVPVQIRRPPPRTKYGFYPNYEGGEAPPAGEIVVRFPAPAPVRVGDRLEIAVSLDDLLLFDRTGSRIRLGLDRNS